MSNRVSSVGQPNRPALARRRRERGQIVAVAAISMVAMVAMAALAVDVGYARFEKRRMQTAADSAAVAAAYALNTGLNYTTAAQSDSSLNGFTNGANGVTVAAQNPPTSGAYAGNNNYVEADVSQTQPTFLLKAIGINSIPVTVRAVAASSSGLACIYGLDPSGSAILASGSPTVISQCAMLSDSNMTVGGTATVHAAAFYVTGTYSGPGPPQVNPAPTTGDLPASDPLSYLSSPATGSCAQNNYHVTSHQTVTISAGTYCGGIKVDGGGVLKLLPGTYIFNGGGFTVNGSATVESVNSDGSVGGGVTIYNTYSAGNSYSPINLDGSATIILTAPTTGGYAGILFFDDRSISSAQTNTINGNSSSTFQGALYFPATTLSFGGSGSTAAYTILVAKDVIFTGGATFSNNYSSLPSGLSPIKTEGVAE